MKGQRWWRSKILGRREEGDEEGGGDEGGGGGGGDIITWCPVVSDNTSRRHCQTENNIRHCYLGCPQQL